MGFQPAGTQARPFGKLRMKCPCHGRTAPQDGINSVAFRSGPVPLSITCDHEGPGNGEPMTDNWIHVFDELTKSGVPYLH